MVYNDLSLQRKQEIENALLALMQEIPYDRIPVKDLTDSLQIARKTFYHYFHNKQACLEALMDRMILECDLCVASLPQKMEPADIYKARLLFWIRNTDFLHAIHRNSLSSLFAERILHYIRQENLVILSRLSAWKLTCNDDILYCYVSGQVCLLLKWCSEGFALPLEEMVQTTLQLVQLPLLQHKEN